MRPPTEHVHDRRGWAGPRIATRLAVALWLTLGLVAIEAAAGMMANSLALITDAVHNLTDVAALALSWFAIRLQSRPASATRTFGYHRFGILVAMVNSGGLLVMSLFVLLEAYRRLLEPSRVNAAALMGVGIAAFIVNLVTALMIRREGEKDLNLRSTFLHLMGDVASTAAAVAAGAGIYLTGADWMDPAASAVIAILIVIGAWGVLREAIAILLEATPHDINMESLVRDLSQVHGVLGVHDLHVWSLSKDLRTMSVHLLTDEAGLRGSDRIRGEITALLAANYKIAHATLQLECSGCEPAELFCDMEGRAKVGPG